MRPVNPLASIAEYTSLLILNERLIRFIIEPVIQPLCSFPLVLPTRRLLRAWKNTFTVRKKRKIRR